MSLLIENNLELELESIKLEKTSIKQSIEKESTEKITEQSVPLIV